MCKQFGIHVSGPLEPFVSGFLDELARQGYSPWSATSYLVVMRHLSCWLGDQEFAVAELTPQRVQEFVAERRACGYAKGRSTGGMVRVLINYLSSIGAIPEVMPRVPEVHLAWVLDVFAEPTRFGPGDHPLVSVCGASVPVRLWNRRRERFGRSDDR